MSTNHTLNSADTSGITLTASGADGTPFTITDTGSINNVSFPPAGLTARLPVRCCPRLPMPATSPQIVTVFICVDIGWMRNLTVGRRMLREMRTVWADIRLYYISQPN